LVLQVVVIPVSDENKKCKLKHGGLNREKQLSLVLLQHNLEQM